MNPNVRIIVDCLEIGGLGLGLMILCYLWRFRYEVEGYRQYRVSTEKGYSKYMWIFLLLAAALVFKLVLAAYYKGHETDMNCFYGWSDMIYENGIGKFYHLDAFTDYPPGYMLILWVVEAISRLFSIETMSTASRVMIKLVPILADLAAGFMLWKIARKRLSEGSSCMLAGLYVFSPMVLVNSSVWGQTDSVFTLCVILTCYFCMQKKRIPAYFLFVIGVFIKPQTLMFAPILIWTFIEQVFMDGFKWKKAFIDLVGGLLAIGSFFLMAAPFGLGAVLTQYTETLSSYPYCTVNAYNFWAMLGKNWASQDDTFLGFPIHVLGTLVIFASVIFSALAFFKLKKREDDSRYFISPAIVIGTMFLFSVRMHERYLFPIVILLGIAFALKPTRERFACFAGFSFLHFLNVAHIYKNANINGVESQVQGGFIGLTAALTIAMYAYMWFAIWTPTGVLDFVAEIKSKGRRQLANFISVKNEDEPRPHEARKKFTIKRTKVMPKFTKLDWAVMLGIMLVYGVVAICNLGSTEAPQTERNMHVNQDPVVLDLGENKKVEMLFMYLGHSGGARFTVDLSQDGTSYETLGELRVDDVFDWNKVKKADEDQTSYNLAKEYRYIRVTGLDNEDLVRELVVEGPDKEVIKPVNADAYPELFDEQDLFVDPVTWREGTYFDEVYHARTAQEMIEGAYCYENTHPPLGKFLISLGIRVFGMTPFGWRIVGTLFGIGMLPLLFMFARRLFGGKTWAAGIAAGLFSVDFMHFTQTRISTIDVYGTFFIIAMFFFMYWYSQMSFYDTKLWKTFVPLVGAAISMGLGCASKWTAVYAAAGMGIFFFVTVVQRYREYRFAKADPTGVTNGIEHEHIIKVWWRFIFITLGVCVLLFIVLAGLIYLLSYIPFSNGQEMGLWDRMIKNQVDMFNYHANLEATHPYSSVWYEWPIINRPVFYYSGTTPDGMSEAISALGNPLIWWSGILALFYLLYRVIRYSDGKALFLCFAYAVQLAPWVLVTRCTFLYHYFPCVPFLILMIVYIMTILDAKEDKKWRRWIYVYMGAAFALFVLFYPAISGTPVPGSQIRDGLKWLPDWTMYL